MAQLLKDSRWPGMKVLVFAFDSRESTAYLPHNYIENCICYTGTHDNTPLKEWHDEVAKKDDLKFARDYLGLNSREGFNWGIIRGGMGSVACLFVAQMQDYLEQGKGHRINTPGTASDNWQWRMLPGEASEKLAKKLFDLCVLYGRAERPVVEKNEKKPAAVKKEKTAE